MKLIYFSLFCTLPLMLNAMDNARAQAGNADARKHSCHSCAEDGDISTWLASAEKIKPIVYSESTYLESLFRNNSLTYTSVAEYLSSIDLEKNRLRLKPFLDKHQNELEGSADAIIAMKDPSFEKIEHAFTCLFILSKISHDAAEFIDKRIRLVRIHEPLLQELRSRGLQSPILNEIIQAIASCKMLQYIKRGEEAHLLEDDEETLSAKLNPRFRRPSISKTNESEISSSQKKGAFSFLRSPKSMGTLLLTGVAIAAYLFLKRYKEKTGKPSLLDFALSRQDVQ